MGKVVICTRPAPNVLLLTLSRPKAKNAVNMQMIDELVKALDDASRDETVRAIIISGDPAGKAFCAGADLSPGGGFNSRSEKAASKPGKPSRTSYRDTGGFTTLAALRCTKPIIAALNGAAVGWGLALPLACDIRIAAENAKVGFTMAARGLVNESCSSFLLPRVVGPGVANELVFTGRVFYAREAPAGLFNHVLPEEQVMEKAMAIAQEIAGNTSGMSVAMCKSLMQDGWESTPEQAMLNESACLHWVTYEKNKDLKEGITAFMSKRKPKWEHDAWNDLPDFVPFRPRMEVSPGRQRSKM